MKFRSTLAAAVVLAMTACGEAPAANGKPASANAKAASAASKPAEAAAVSNKNVPDDVVMIKNGSIFLYDSVENIREREQKSVDEMFREVMRWY